MTQIKKRDRHIIEY